MWVILHQLTAVDTASRVLVRGMADLIVLASVLPGCDNEVVAERLFVGSGRDLDDVLVVRTIAAV